ncbi:MAG: hypothetical protein RIT45_3341 [Pseudomonadota bacterium]
MRLDRLISQHCGLPRRQVGAVIRAGRVEIDGVVVRNPAVHVATSADLVLLDGKPVRQPAELVLMMHKPPGVISATTSDEHETVIDRVPESLRHKRLAPAGRLDKDTTGLLLLCTDGGLQHLVTHPRRKLEKAYIATLRPGTLEPDAEARFADGMTLADGTPCRPAGLERLADDRVRVTLTEGRFHQVKRMLGHCGGHVVALHRERIGPLWLDPVLGPGEVRPLSDAELAALMAAVAPARFGSEPDSATQFAPTADDLE